MKKRKQTHRHVLKIKCLVSISWAEQKIITFFPIKSNRKEQSDMHAPKTKRNWNIFLCGHKFSLIVRLVVYLIGMKDDNHWKTIYRHKQTDTYLSWTQLRWKRHKAINFCVGVSNWKVKICYLLWVNNCYALKTKQ